MACRRVSPNSLFAAAAAVAVLALVAPACSSTGSAVDAATRSDTGALDSAARDQRLADITVDQTSPGDAAADVAALDGQPDQATADGPPADVAADAGATDVAPADVAVAHDFTADAAIIGDIGIASDAGTTNGVVQSGNLEPGTPATFNRSIVMDSSGRLYACYKAATAPYTINIARSTDGGATWKDWASKLSSETFAYGVTGCGLAVDGSDNLYAVWCRYSYTPTRHGTYFRKYNASTSSWDAQQTIKEINNKTATCGVAVDSQDSVWLLAGAADWHFHLWKSDQPKAANNKFSDLGDPSTSGYSQNGAMTIDSNGNVHVTFYSARSGGAVFHRYYNGGWKKETQVSDTAGGNDVGGPMAADALGNVHIVYVEQGSRSDSPHRFRYRKWSNGTLGPYIEIFSHSVAQHNQRTTTNAFIQNIGVREDTGEVYYVARNMNWGGSMVLYSKSLSQSTFTPLYRISLPNTGNHYYYMPRLRGTVYPTFNRTGSTLDVSWTRDRSASPSEQFHRLKL